MAWFPGEAHRGGQVIKTQDQTGDPGYGDNPIDVVDGVDVLDLEDADDVVVHVPTKRRTAQTSVQGRPAWAETANTCRRIQTSSHRAAGILSRANHGNDHARGTAVQDRFNEDMIIPRDAHQGRRTGSARSHNMRLYRLERLRTVFHVNPDEI